MMILVSVPKGPLQHPGLFSGSPLRTIVLAVNVSHGVSGLLQIAEEEWQVYSPAVISLLESCC